MTDARYIISLVTGHWILVTFVSRKAEGEVKTMLEEKLKNLPEKPGVYLMKNDKDNIIYVGKALNLKNRVRSYFTSQHANSPKTKALVSNIADLEYILTDTEVEALILECNLIKEHKPKYNIRLTDDKNYPYLRVTVQEPFPRIEVVRAMKKDGARYFGPYTSAGAVHETLKLLKRLFPLRSCKQRTFEKQERPCLNSHIKRCVAPCSGRISQEEYRKMIQEVILFLEGKQEDLTNLLNKRMEEAAENLQFEKAAEIRDQLLAIEKVIAKQKIISGSFANMDVINMARGFNEACVQVFFVRSGKLIGRDHFFLFGTDEKKREEILAAFIKQYYSQVDFIPGEILLPEDLEEAAVLETWLSGKRGSKVQLKVPKRGDKYQLVELVGKNAQEALEQEARTKAQAQDRAEEALKEIAEALEMDEFPQRMECYDISNIQGSESVASMVVFEGGKASPQEYRRFKIKTVEGPNDFASMAEVIFRRFKKAREGDAKFSTLPDLVIIDGGKGQLAAAREMMHQLGYGSIMTVGLAKENEWLYREDCSEPIILPRNSQGLYLIQRIRDEAHRFALTYHRLLRGKRNLASVLNEIPGIGPKRKEALLRHFGLSLNKIKGASLEELLRVPGLTREAATNVWNYFHPAEMNDVNREP